LNYKALNILVTMSVLAFVTMAYASSEDRRSSKADRSVSTESPDLFFDIRIPDDFKAEPVDEIGILKWKKDSAEIYLVVGELVADSGETLFKELRKAADNDKTIKEIRVLHLKGGKGFIMKEKPPEDPSRNSTWRIIAVTDKKEINVDFTAPAKDFESYTQSFEEAIHSFKLK
jgi:hypothetical protein